MLILNNIIINGAGCYKNDNDYEIKIIDTYKDESSGMYLTFEVVNCQGHLGFEVIENNVVIGFTTTVILLIRMNILLNINLNIK